MIGLESRYGPGIVADPEDDGVAQPGKHVSTRAPLTQVRGTDASAQLTVMLLRERELALGLGRLRHRAMPSQGAIAVLIKFCHYLERSFANCSNSMMVKRPAKPFQIQKCSSVG